MLLDLFPAYHVLRQAKLVKIMEKSHSKTNVNKIMVDPKMNIDMSDVFDMLHIDSPCCKMHYATSVNFIDMLLTV